ncbi:MAG: caspase family protein [Rectinema sp.]
MRSEQKPSRKNPGLGRRRPALQIIVLFALAAFALAFSGCELFPSSAASFGGRKYAVIVGINDYIIYPDVDRGDLSYCVADAESMQKMLEDAGWTVTLLTTESNDPKPTKEGIKDALLKNVPPDTATFLFYYSGHGYIGSPEEAYIVPSDVNNSSSTSAFYSSLILSREFSVWLDSITATNKLVILDSCYSGGFVDPGDSVDSIIDSSISTSSALDMFFRFGELLAQNAAAASSDPSTAPLVISAAGWAEESLEALPYGHGIFTYYFLQSAETNQSGTMKGDSDGDDVLSCIEAYSYAKRQLVSDPGISENQKFIPHISGGLRDFALIDNR